MILSLISIKLLNSLKTNKKAKEREVNLNIIKDNLLSLKWKIKLVLNIRIENMKLLMIIEISSYHKIDFAMNKLRSSRFQVKNKRL